jgi:uncharacterized protein (DUF302 family)
MSVPARARSIRTPVATRTSAVIRAVGAAVALAVVGTACAGNAGDGLPPAPPAAPNQPAGTLVVPAGTDMGTAVQRVRDAITADGGTVVTVVDHAADARAAGVQIPPITEVIGGPPAAQLALLRVDQRAAVNLPQHYLVRQAPDGTVSLTVNSADYIAAVSGVTAPDARTALRDTTGAVIGQAAPGSDTVLASPLVGVTPAKYLLTHFGTNIPATVDRLRRNADRRPTRSIAVVDMAAGSADPGPAIRPTTVVFVSVPEAEAPLLAAAPSIGLDLPLRFVVWLDDRNRTQVGYPDVRRLAARHGVSPDDPNVARLVSESDRLARLGAGILE